MWIAVAPPSEHITQLHYYVFRYLIIPRYFIKPEIQHVNIGQHGFVDKTPAKTDIYSMTPAAFFMLS